VRFEVCNLTSPMRPTSYSTAVLLLLSLGCGPELSPEEPLDTASVESEICASGSTVEGIDVSRYQGTINWGGVGTSGKKFAIIQAGRGTSPDPEFARNWAGAKANGIIRGTYLRFFPDQSLTAQANILIQANATAVDGDLPPMLDVEDRGSTSPSRLASLVKDLVAKVKAGTGRTPIIYTGYYFWKDYVQSTAFGEHPLVIANYGTSCPMIPAGWNRWTVHQYSSTGRVAGISGNVDLDRFNGTMTQLRALTGGAPVVPPVDPVATKGVLTGAIYKNGDISQRLADATVTVDGHTQTTGADGIFRFSLPGGTYTVTARKAGFEARSVVRTVIADNTVWGSMNLARSVSDPGTLVGVIYEEGDTSQRVSGAVVTVDGESKVTGADGIFRFSVSAAYKVVAKKSGFGNASATRDVTAGATVWASMNLPRVISQSLVTGEEPVSTGATGVSGRLYRLDSLAAIVGGQAELRTADGTVVSSGATDANGAYRLLLTGNFQGHLVIRADGLQEQTLALTIVDGEERLLNVGMAPEDSLTADDEPYEPALEPTAEGAGGCSTSNGLELFALLGLIPLLGALTRRRTLTRVPVRGDR
jgi:GH25 family lysozyme M1 (1,4-beta-N-acetylmuramidase)